MAEFKYDVFISYSHKDEEWVVNTLLPALENARLKVCIDYRDFGAGKPSIVNMEDAVDESRHTVLVLTPNWTGSEWTDLEAVLTQTDDPVGRRQKMIPIMLEKCDPPKRVRSLTYVDFTREDRENIAWEQLLKACNVKAELVQKAVKNIQPQKQKPPNPSSIQSINSQQAKSIYNVPGGTINVNQEESFQHEQDFILPGLEIKLLDNMKQYVDQLTFSQIVNNQDFHFGIALINNIEGSLPAEKLDITIECSWDGADIQKAPKFKTDEYNRTTMGWTALKELVQQGETPSPAKLSFQGTANDRCAFSHNREWYRFSVVLAERMRGRFILNYRITSAYPKLITAQGTLFIHIEPQG